MAYKESLSREDIDEEVICNPTKPQWIRHNQCGYRFFYLYEATSVSLAAYCPKCKATVLLVLGVNIDDPDGLIQE